MKIKIVIGLLLLMFIIACAPSEVMEEDAPLDSVSTEEEDLNQGLDDLSDLESLEEELALADLDLDDLTLE